MGRVTTLETQSGIPRRNRVLLVTYPFPPVGGAGVQRVTKFVKYLPRHGWDVSVLTVANPSVPVFDTSLAKDIPPDTVVCRARSWEPGYSLKAVVSGGSANERRTNDGFVGRLKGGARRLATLVLQPDPQILWLPAAATEGARLLRRTKHDAVVVSGPPFSSFLLAARLARQAKLPFVLDYRDEWTLSNEYWENKKLDPISRYVQERMQRRVIRSARGLVATTKSSAASLEGLALQVGSKALTTWIYNGFDPDDFTSASELNETRGDLFRLTYTGTLWNLTSVAPLVEAVEKVAAATPAVAARLELVFAGRRTDQQAGLLDRLRRLPCHLVEHPYLDHSAAVSLMRGSEALCLLLSDLPGVGRVVPAKLFEYMATSRPTLTIAPPGEARELLAGYPGGQFDPKDADGIAAWLTTSIQRYIAGERSQAGNWDVSTYTRDAEAAQLAAFLSSLGATDQPQSDT